MKKEKGFTLIELLVVVAIIAILSGIAFISIQGARLRAFDTQIRSELSQVRSNAEMWYYQDARGSYENYDTSSGWETIRGKIPGCSQARLDDDFDVTDSTIYQLEIATGASPQDYIAWAPLCADEDDQIYCIDAEGNSVAVPDANITAIETDLDCLATP